MAGLGNTIKEPQGNTYFALFAVVSGAVRISNQCLDTREIAFLGS